MDFVEVAEDAWMKVFLSNKLKKKKKKVKKLKVF
jgi:hypothetical protein